MSRSTVFRWKLNGHDIESSKTMGYYPFHAMQDSMKISIHSNFLGPLGPQALEQSEVG